VTCTLTLWKELECGGVVPFSKVRLGIVLPDHFTFYFIAQWKTKAR
jgi:hypothetical protein